MQRFDKLSANGWRAVLLLLAAALAALTLPAAAQTFPKFTGLVVDDANVLPADVKADLAAKLESLQKDTGRQLVVATIGDLQGYPLEEYGYKLGRAWGVGLKDVNNGAILFIAPNNPAGQRGPRVEVGRGLEPVLTDALSSVVINQDMMPHLKGGDIPGAMTAGTDALIGQLRASPEEAQARLDAAAAAFNKTHQRRGSNGDGDFPLGLVFWGLVIGFVVLSIARRGGGGGGRRYRGSGGGGLGNVILWGIANEIASGAFRGGGGGGGGGGVRGWGGGGGGGSDGSWGGGGFTGGGGGDFGGGGASGSW